MFGTEIKNFNLTTSQNKLHPTHIPMKEINYGSGT